jgi:predicted ATP-dependent endonuclease of OLD family
MDVQQSDINYLQEQAKKLNYSLYLPKLRMLNVRSFENQQISFDFPVTAIIGTNGGGKSTVLGAAALAYKSTKPSDFFPKSNIGDTSMANWRIEYEIIDRNLNKSAPISRNARFASARWKRDSPPERNVVSIPIQRTVPANEQAKFRRFIGTLPLGNVQKVAIQPHILKLVSRILGKTTADYKRITLKSDTSKSILIGVSKGNDYSQFHFGAGEASIIEMVDSIERAPENSLILIEEIENGLHPIATRKMVEYLGSGFITRT